MTRQEQKNGGGRQAIILSGGGAHGAFEVGVLKALLGGRSPSTGGAPIDPAVFTGTSVGAFNAAFLVSRSGVSMSAAVEALEEVWLDEIAERSWVERNGVLRFRGNPLPFLDPRWLAHEPVARVSQLVDDGYLMAGEAWRRGLKFGRSSGRIENRALELFDLSALISTEPFAALVQRTVPLDAIRRSDKVLKLVATSWESGELRVFDNRDMDDGVGHKAIQASAAIPGIFAPVEIDGRSYVDGGVLMNTPLKPAIDAQAEVLHVVYLDPDVAKIPVQRLRSMLDTMDRTMTIQFAMNMNRDVETVRQINVGLRLIRQGPESAASGDLDRRPFLRTASRLRREDDGPTYRPLTVHRYHPDQDLGGVLSLLDFDRARVEELIAMGLENGTSHDCMASGCVLP